MHGPTEVLGEANARGIETLDGKKITLRTGPLNAVGAWSVCCAPWDMQVIFTYVVNLEWRMMTERSWIMIHPTIWVKALRPLLLVRVRLSELIKRLLAIQPPAIRSTLEEKLQTLEDDWPNTRALVQELVEGSVNSHPGQFLPRCRRSTLCKGNQTLTCSRSAALARRAERPRDYQPGDVRVHARPAHDRGAGGLCGPDGAEGHRGRQVRPERRRRQAAAAGCL